MKSAGRVAVTVLLGTVYLAAAVAASIPEPVSFLPLAAAAVAAELIVQRRFPAALPAVFAPQLDVRFRLLSIDVLVTVLCARIESGGAVVAATIAAVGLLHLTRDLSGVFRRRAAWWRAGGPVGWRNLAVAGHPTPRSGPPAATLGIPTSAMTLVLPAGFLLDELGVGGAAAVVALVVVFAICIGYVGARSVQYLVSTRRDRDAVRAAVRDAVAAVAPAVVLHVAGRRGTSGNAAMWLPALARLHQSVLVVVREQSHVDELAPYGLPIVFAPLSTDVERFMVESVDLALYVSDATNINNHMIRVPGILDVLVGHGDADSAENASPIARMYDSLGGRSARADSGTRPLLGVAADRVRTIGQVPLPEPAALPSDTIVYAPEWENVVDSAGTSSVVEGGEAIVRAALARPGHTLVFAPHPATGSRVPEYAAARDALAALVRLGRGAPRRGRRGPALARRRRRARHRRHRRPGAGRRSRGRALRGASYLGDLIAFEDAHPTVAGGVVLDPASGSGIALALAAERGRRVRHSSTACSPTATSRSRSSRRRGDRHAARPPLVHPPDPLTAPPHRSAPPREHPAAEHLSRTISASAGCTRSSRTMANSVLLKRVRPAEVLAGQERRSPLRRRVPPHVHDLPRDVRHERVNRREATCPRRAACPPARHRTPWCACPSSCVRVDAVDAHAEFGRLLGQRLGEVHGRRLRRRVHAVVRASTRVRARREVEQLAVGVLQIGQRLLGDDDRPKQVHLDGVLHRIRAERLEPADRGSAEFTT